MIKVVNKKNHIPQTNDYFIGRGSPLGNPYTHLPLHTTHALYQSESRKEAIKSYENYLIDILTKKQGQEWEYFLILHEASKRGDINLVCYCKPKSCHGDIIKKYLELNIIEKNGLFHV